MGRKIKQCESVLDAERLNKIKRLLCEGYRFSDIEKEMGINNIFQYLSSHISFFEDLSFKKVREVNW